MNVNFLILALAGISAIVSGGIIVYFVLGSKSKNNIHSLMGRKVESRNSNFSKNKVLNEEEIQKAKVQARKSVVKDSKKVTLSERFFMAGLFTKEEQKKYYYNIQIAGAFICGVFAINGFYSMGLLMALLGAVFGAYAGYLVPASFLLDMRIKARAEDVLYYLPLVIEQIVIGVSSSLDIGPCLQRVVQMADERDTHNAVTELLRHAQNHVRSGVSMEDALVEVGKMSGSTEVKHAFMSLGQVAKHGGEITRQLQELADAVAGQRETKIEAKIKTLELKATGPVALVFVAFLMIILIGFGLQFQLGMAKS
ncbi:MAG: type II secretion system F family protein [Bdellovibrionales bacterium]|nr:type II secretion system F family protein [Bdellovibrionales bacterium]